MPPRILILSEPTVASYGTIGVLYRDTFERLGLPCEMRPYPLTERPRAPRGSIVLHATLGFRFTPVPGAVNIAVPFHEWSRYPAEWGERMSGFDAVWAASRHIAEVLQRSGVGVPLRFAPPALDLTPPPRKRSWRGHRPFRFLFIGEPHFRKGHHLLIAGFQLLGASRRTAVLTIKTSADCPWRVSDPNVDVIAARWSRDRLLGLYRTSDAFVSASLGEGLGLGVAEAMLAGLPVATNQWGGHRSLLAPGGYVRIAHRVTPQPFCSKPEYFAPGQACALSSPEAIAEAMEQLLTMTAHARQVQAGVAARHVTERFGIGAVGVRLRAALESAGRRPRE
jgi:glycosyltransferase involved in cell wall biosynthesis